MAKLETYVCDVCGVQKKDTNHWYVAVADSILDFVAFRWDIKPAYVPASNLANAKFSHLCGTDCLTKLLARWTEGLSK